MVSDALPEELRQKHSAATLVIRQGADLLLKQAAAADALLHEHATVAYDKQFWHSRQKKTMNKQARYNVVFGPDGIAHNDSFEQPTVLSLLSAVFDDHYCVTGACNRSAATIKRSAIKPSQVARPEGGRSVC